MRLEIYLDKVFAGDAGSDNDPRFKFAVGDLVAVTDTSTEQRRLWIEQHNHDPQGHIGKVLSRRNAYPPPGFEGYWVPIYFVDGLGEIGESCLGLKE